MQKNKVNKYGFAIILVMLIMTTLLFLSLYILSFALNENLIAESQTLGAKTYYLAEAGINNMLWLVKNDSDTMSNFETQSAWSTSTVMQDPFGANSGTCTTTLTNTSPAHAEIIAQAHTVLGAKKSAQRTIKTLIFKPMGDSGVAGSSGYADGNIKIFGSQVNFLKGDAHSNNVFNINKGSVVTVEGDLRAVGNYLNNGSTLNLSLGGEIYAANEPNGPADEIAMPAVDFNSSDPNSYYNRADKIYSTNDFDDLMDTNQILTLTDPITYVEGDVELKGEQTLKLENALLVVERDFTVGFKKNGHGRNGPSSVIVTHTSGKPSGILAGRHVDFKEYTDTIDINGIVYAVNLMNLTNINDFYTNNFYVKGGLLARKLTMTSCWQEISIEHDNEILASVLDDQGSAPTIVIEHWEEEY